MGMRRDEERGSGDEERVPGMRRGPWGRAGAGFAHGCPLSRLAYTRPVAETENRRRRAGGGAGESDAAAPIPGVSSGVGGR